MDLGGKSAGVQQREVVAGSRICGRREYISNFNFNCVSHVLVMPSFEQLNGHSGRYFAVLSSAYAHKIHQTR
jgi:hypothetical protein